MTSTGQANGAAGKSGMLIGQFSTEAGFGSAAIRYLSAGYYSHVDLVVPRAVALRHMTPLQIPPLTRCGLLGARTKGGVLLRPDNYAHFTHFVRVGCVVPDIEAAYAFAFAQIGKPYNMGAILDFFLHKFGNPNIYNPDQRSWFCDELYYEIYKAGGVQLLQEANPRNLSPQAVYESPWLLPQAK